MKKFIYLAVVMMLSAGFAACSDDDDDKPKKVEITSSGTQDSPASWGKEVTLTGKNFSTNSATTFYMVPQGDATSTDAIALTPTVTSKSLTFKAPFTPEGGAFDLYQATGSDIYPVATIYFEEQKFVSNLTLSTEFYITNIDVEYNNGNLAKIIKKSFGKDDDEFTLKTTHTSTFTFNSSNNLTGIKNEETSENYFTGKDTTIVTSLYEFKYNGASSVTMIYTDGDENSEVIRTSTLTLDNNGLLSARTEEWRGVVDWDAEKEENIFGNFKTVYAYQYDSRYNMTEMTSQEYKEGEVNGDGKFMRLTLNAEHSFFPKTALPVWFWSIFTEGFLFSTSIAYNNSVASFTVPGMSWIPGAPVEDAVNNFKYTYDSAKYPIAIYHESTMVGLDDQPIFNSITYKTK